LIGLLSLAGDQAGRMHGVFVLDPLAPGGASRFADVSSTALRAKLCDTSCICDISGDMGPSAASVIAADATGLGFRPLSFPPVAVQSLAHAGMRS
jgi:hypothetical protein